MAHMTKKEKKIQEVEDVLDRVEGLSDDDVVAEFGSCEAGAITWECVLKHLGRDYNLIMKAGKPRGRWATNIIDRGKKAHARARRDHLKDQKHRALWRSMNDAIARGEDEQAAKRAFHDAVMALYP